MAIDAWFSFPEFFCLNLSESAEFTDNRGSPVFVLLILFFMMLIRELEVFWWPLEVGRYLYLFSKFD